MDITLTPEVIHSLTNLVITKQAFGMLFAVIGFFLIMAIIFDFIPSLMKKIIDPKGSKEYRNLLSDMYVVGMVKKLAKEDDINLLSELKELNKISKKGKIELRTIDRVVEEELKEKIAKVQEEAIQKPSKKE